MSITTIVKKIRELNSEELKLKNALNALYNEKTELTKQWQNLCSHPKEYREVVERYYDDDYGKMVSIDPKDYKYECGACGKKLENTSD
jgi:predicted nuclease with TOPRIM domain